VCNSRDAAGAAKKIIKHILWYFTPNSALNSEKARLGSCPLDSVRSITKIPLIHCATCGELSILDKYISDLIHN
jgi:hypothetical protein